MSNYPDRDEAEQLQALYEGNPIIDTAEAALRAIGADLDRATARKLLQIWKYTPALSVRERRAVLARFPLDLDDGCRRSPDRARLTRSAVTRADVPGAAGTGAARH